MVAEIAYKKTTPEEEENPDLMDFSQISTSILGFGQKTKVVQNFRFIK